MPASGCRWLAAQDPSHYTYRNPRADPAAVIAASIAQLRAKVAELGGPERVAAFYAEPIQGSGGVLVPPAGWMKAMRDLAPSSTSFSSPTR